MCDMGNKLWYERHLCICDSFTRHLLVANSTGKSSLWHWCPIRDQEHSACLSQILMEMPKNAKNGSQVQLTLLHEHSVFWGLERTNQGEKCCHVVRGPQGLPRWFQGLGGPELYPATQGSRGRLEPLLAAQETVSEAPEPKTCERVRKWHFPWIGKAHGSTEETQSELYFIIWLNFNIFSQSTVKEVQPSCVSHIGFQF